MPGLDKNIKGHTESVNAALQEVWRYGFNSTSNVALEHALYYSPSSATATRINYIQMELSTTYPTSIREFIIDGHLYTEARDPQFLFPVPPQDLLDRTWRGHHTSLWKFLMFSNILSANSCLLGAFPYASVFQVPQAMYSLAYERGYRFRQDGQQIIITPPLGNKSVYRILANGNTKPSARFGISQCFELNGVHIEVITTKVYGAMKAFPPEIDSFCHYNIVTKDRIVFAFYTTLISRANWHIWNETYSKQAVASRVRAQVARELRRQLAGNETLVGVMAVQDQCHDSQY